METQTATALGNLRLGTGISYPPPVSRDAVGPHLIRGLVGVRLRAIKGFLIDHLQKDQTSAPILFLQLSSHPHKEKELP